MVSGLWSSCDIKRVSTGYITAKATLLATITRQVALYVALGELLLTFLPNQIGFRSFRKFPGLRSAVSGKGGSQLFMPVFARFKFVADN